LKGSDIYLRNGRDRIDVGDSRGLDADEREEEAEDKCEKGLSDIHVELCGEDRAAHDGRQEKPDGPPSERNAVGDRSL
jgi:hypothetical protein